MDLTPEQKGCVAEVATQSLERFREIADAAARELGRRESLSSDSLVRPDSPNAPTALANLARIQRAIHQGNEHLLREPAVARVEVIDDAHRSNVYYICRTTPVTGVRNLASYRSPVGRLAALPIGESIILPNDVSCVVVAKAKLYPVTDKAGWDSQGTEVHSADFGPVTISSLREFLNSLGDAELAEDILDQIHAQERLSESLISGLRRSVITKMGLRDQPILNRIQDEIFRLPIDRRLVLLGPPGTGKTTTLIRRLGQKLDEIFLTDDEKEVIDAANAHSQLPHDESWLMFTPTKLLRLYLKEAFARELVPAPDARIQTWDDFRWSLSKNIFGILRGATGSGFFVLRDDVAYLSEETLSQAISWFEDYFKWQREEFRRELGEAASSLTTTHIASARALSGKLVAAIETSGWNALIGEAKEAQKLVDGIKGSTEDKIQQALREQLGKNPRFIDEFAQFLDALGPEGSAAGDDDVGETEDEEEAEVVSTPKAKAITRYKSALRSHAKALASKRSIDKSSRLAEVIAWIGDRSLPTDQLTEIGKGLVALTNLRPFTNPMRRYMTGFHRRYRKFRTARQAEGRWYSAPPNEVRDIGALELDLILLAILRTGREFLSRQQVLLRLDEPLWSSFKPIQELYRNQVLVDEATDFSPVQLACMAALANPRSHSFFACGDFNQRLTFWGTRSVDELNWAVQGLEYREVNIAYRQTRQLNIFARDIISALGGSDPIVELPEAVDNEGVAPALVEGMASHDALATWMAERLQEMEKFVGQMPSTAIFVNSEEKVAPMAEMLNKALKENNLRVVPCSNGQVVGQDSDIRVFDLQHIKGLEFEAVFFVDLDELAESQPSLFDKYLYVGATRAATYLGVSCIHQLPEVMEPLRPHFVANWSTHGQHDASPGH